MLVVLCFSNSLDTEYDVTEGYFLCDSFSVDFGWDHCRSLACT